MPIGLSIVNQQRLSQCGKFKDKIMTDAGRRKYWTQTMDSAYEFMKRASDVPIDERMEKLVYLPEVADKAGVEVTFSDKPHVDNLPRLFYLRQGQIKSFVKIAEEFNSHGWILHVEDAYRTKEMQQKLAREPYIFNVVLQKCRWEIQDEKVSAELLRKRSAALVSSWPKVAPHMSGSALDISVYNRADSKQIDRGADYCELSELSPMASPFPSAQAQKNRKDITGIFAKYEFSAYPYEFWHYSNNDIFDMTVNNTSPARYGAIDWDIVKSVVNPLKDQFTPLNSEQDFLKLGSHL